MNKVPNKFKKQTTFFVFLGVHADKSKLAVLEDILDKSLNVEIVE